MVLEPALARPPSLGSLAGAGQGAARRRSVIMITGTKRQASKQQARQTRIISIQILKCV